MTRRLAPLWLAAVAALGAAAAAAPQQDGPAARLEVARQQLEQAENLDARKHLPRSYRVARAAVQTAEELRDQLRQADETTDPGAADALARAVREAERTTARLLDWARFVQQMRRDPEPWEAVAGEIDETLVEIARAAEVDLPADLGFPASARALATAISSRRMERRVWADSLNLAVRVMRQSREAETAAQESTVTALRAQVSALRRDLWQAELRADLAENERSEAQGDLERRRAREEAIRNLSRTFAPGEGTVLLTPDGQVILRLQGLSFAVGSAELRPGSEALLDKAVAALAAVPGDRLRVEGHTDDTGGHALNLRLSKARAETVARILEERLGIPPENVETVGYGPDRPVAPNDTAAGRAQNRRIDIVVLSGE